VDLIHEPSLKTPILIEELRATRKLGYESESVLPILPPDVMGVYVLLPG